MNQEILFCLCKIKFVNYFFVKDMLYNYYIFYNLLLIVFLYKGCIVVGFDVDVIVWDFEVIWVIFVKIYYQVSYIIVYLLLFLYYLLYVCICK